MNHRRKHPVELGMLLLAIIFIGQGFYSLPPDYLNINQAPSASSFPYITSGQSKSGSTSSKEVFRWVLAYWKTNSVACNLFLENTGEPTKAEIAESCGEDILMAWENTPPCLRKKTTKCTGLYLSFVGMATPEEVEQISHTPKITISASTLNCPAWGVCDENPKLVFTVESDFQPAVGRSLAIQIGDEVTYCNDTSCTLDMPATKPSGRIISYWIETEGEGTLYEHSFRMRNITLEGDKTTHLVQLLGDQWQGAVDTCANTWDHFPDLVSEQSSWIARGDDPDFLYTTEDYALLAGKLIWHGYVDAAGCEDNGLLPNGAANACGQEHAHDLVVEWQNRLDPVILAAADKTFIPPRLLKGLIAQETQFWPLWPEKNEFGYGMMTEKGIDMLLTWNMDYYLNLCQRYYTPDVCMGGYSSLTDQQRQFLRGASLLAVGTNEEFVLLANMLQATCMQSYQMIKNITEEEPNVIFTYESLWRISLGVYHAGVGCMGEAVDYAWNDYGGAMSWEDFKIHIQPDCEGATDYFDKVVYYGGESN